MDCFFVALRHLIGVLRHRTRGIILVILSHILQHLHKWWYLDLFALLGGLYPEQTGCAVHVAEGLDHEVLLLVDEALPDLLQLLHRGVPLALQQLDVLTCTNLPLLHYALVILVEPNLMVVVE